MADIVIIGGSIMGLQHRLSSRGGPARPATSASSNRIRPTNGRPRPGRPGGVRLMHGLVENIEMSRYGQEFYKDFANRVDVDGPARKLRVPRARLPASACRCGRRGGGRDELRSAKRAWRVERDDRPGRAQAPLPFDPQRRYRRGIAWAQGRIHRPECRGGGLPPQGAQSRCRIHPRPGGRDSRRRPRKSNGLCSIPARRSMATYL